MKKYLMVCILETLLSQGVLADCNIWKLEVQDKLTSETKIFTYHLGEQRQVPIPGLKKFKCSFEVSKVLPSKGNEVGASFKCGPTDKKDNFSMNTSVVCFDAVPGKLGAFNGFGSFSITDVDKKTGKLTAYTFFFNAE